MKEAIIRITKIEDTGDFATYCIETPFMRDQIVREWNTSIGSIMGVFNMVASRVVNELDLDGSAKRQDEIGELKGLVEHLIDEMAELKAEIKARTIADLVSKVTVRFPGAHGSEEASSPSDPPASDPHTDTLGDTPVVPSREPSGD